MFGLLEFVVAKIGRNQPCPCGSKRKYKHCCLPKHGEAIKEKKSTEADLCREVIQRMIVTEHEQKMNEIIGRKLNGATN